MSSEVSSSVSHQTVYVQDIIPQQIKDLLKEPSYDLDKILLHQIKVVSTCKKAVLQERAALITAIDKKCDESGNSSCGPYSSEFLALLLKDIQEDEADARRKVLGEQEGVEMFKRAFAEDAISEHHLAAARAYRDAMTMRLADIVEGREIVFIAQEILHRSPQALVPQFEPELEALGLAYTKVRETHVKECDILKKLTEWKKKPELHITEEDELFSFFSDETPSSFLNAPVKDEQEEVFEDAVVEEEEEEEKSELASALASCEEEAQKLVHFRKTKVDSVDKEFNVLADLASDILKYEDKMNEGIAFIKQTPGCIFPPDSPGIEQYLAYLRMKYTKLKFKISIKGYNFSLKVMQRTKSVISLDVLTTLLNTNQEYPEEVNQAQKTITELSKAVKRICSKYGRCAMAFQSIIKREKELETIIREAPKVNYAESIRISENFSANMKEVERVNVLKDNVKKIADKVLKDVMITTGGHGSK